MSRRMRAAVLVLGIWAAGSTVLLSAPAAGVSIESLVKSADAIVVAEVKEQVRTAAPAVLVLSVERVLKGDLQSGSIVSARWVPPEMGDTSAVGAGMRGLWFLRGSADTGWDVMPTVVGFVTPRDLLFTAAKSPKEAYAPQPTDSLVDRALLEICAGVAEYSGDESNFDSYRYGVALSAPRSAAAQRCYRALAGSTSPVQRSMGLAALVRSGDVATLQAVSQQVDELAAGRSGSLVMWAISDFANPSPAAVEVLGRLSRIERFERLAAWPLRRFHTKETLPYLARLLDSTNQEVRYQAMAGLADFCYLGGMPTEEQLNSRGHPTPDMRQPRPYMTGDVGQNFPTVQGFKQDEQRYITFWKNWWANHPELHSQP